MHDKTELEYIRPVNYIKRILKAMILIFID